VEVALVLVYEQHELVVDCQIGISILAIHDVAKEHTLLLVVFHLYVHRHHFLLSNSLRVFLLVVVESG